MKANVVYFSQTGNTVKVAEAIAEGLDAGGYRPQLIPLHRAVPEDAVDCNLFGVGAPAQASRPGTPILAYLRGLPLLPQRFAFVFATAGGAPGRTLPDLAAPLKERGARMLGGFKAHGEIAHPAPSINGRFRGRPDREDLAQARGFGRTLADWLLGRSAAPLPAVWRELTAPGRGLYDLIGASTKDADLRRLFPAPNVDHSHCSTCAWCEHACPMENIRLDPYPVAGEDCIRCYHCVNGCPEHARTVERWGMGEVILKGFYNERFERWFGDIQRDERVY